MSDAEKARRLEIADMRLRDHLAAVRMREREAEAGAVAEAYAELTALSAGVA